MPVCQKNTASQHEGSGRNQDQDPEPAATRHSKARRNSVGRHHKQAEKEGSPAPATPSEQGNEADKKQKRARKGSGLWPGKSNNRHRHSDGHFTFAAHVNGPSCGAAEKGESNDNKPGSCPGQPVPGRGAALMGGDPDRRGLLAVSQHPTWPPVPWSLARLPACDAHNIGTGVSTFEAWRPRSL